MVGLPVCDESQRHVSIHHSNGCKLVRPQWESIVAFMGLIFEKGISVLRTSVDLIFESWCFSMSSLLTAFSRNNHGVLLLTLYHFSAVHSPTCYPFNFISLVW